MSLKRQERGRGAGSRIARDVLIEDALIEVDGVRRIAGSLVRVGERHVAVRLRQFGVVLAQDAHPVGA